jgi:hypothetical protein
MAPVPDRLDALGLTVGGRGGNRSERGEDEQHSG